MKSVLVAIDFRKFVSYNYNKRKVSIKEKFIFTSQSNYIFYIYIFTKYHEFLKCVQI